MDLGTEKQASRWESAKHEGTDDSTGGSPYADGRPFARLRMEAEDAGVVFEHGRGPDACDELGAREASVVLHDGVFHLFYDGARADHGWLACLATSTNLRDWTRHGPILDFGAPGRPDFATATSPWFHREAGLWHMFYLGARSASPPPDCVPAPPYLTCKAEAESLGGPWIKRYDVRPVEPVPGSYYGETACPGYLFRHQGKLRMIFSAAAGEIRSDDIVGIERTLGLLTAESPDGPWTVSPGPILPQAEQIENSSLYYEPANDTWFLFTNHVGLADGVEYTDAIWVYWSRDPTRWDPACKAVVMDGSNCSWSRRCIGMPSVVPVGQRLALFYDAPGGHSIGHMRRDIGLAWLDLPLRPPETEY